MTEAGRAIFHNILNILENVELLDRNIQEIGAGGLVMTPTYVEMSWTWLGATRRIYTDGRPHPKDIVPVWMGNSIGRWEGDTLVVDTVGMRASEYDQSGAPHSDKVHLTERLRMIDKDVLENQMTIEDPVVLTEPWKVVRRYKRMPKAQADIVILYCEPTEDHLEFVNGYQQAVLPSELEAKRKQQQEKAPAAEESER